MKNHITYTDSTAYHSTLAELQARGAIFETTVSECGKRWSISADRLALMEQGQKAPKLSAEEKAQKAMVRRAKRQALAIKARKGTRSAFGALWWILKGFTLGVCKLSFFVGSGVVVALGACIVGLVNGWGGGTEC